MTVLNLTAALNLAGLQAGSHSPHRGTAHVSATLDLKAHQTHNPVNENTTYPPIIFTHGVDLFLLIS